jgi:hypothetical protein
MPSPAQDHDFFDTFGYLLSPGLLRDEIGWITELFESQLRERGYDHDPATRTSMYPFIECHERLARIIELPQLQRLVSSLLGDEWSYFCSEANCYTGDTAWHQDGNFRHTTWLKIPIYLDELTRDTGAFRVIAGSHRCLDGESHVTAAERSQELWGIPGRDVPAVALESHPGDVVAFNAPIMHAAFGGGTRRRMVSMIFSGPVRTPEQFAELDRLMTIWANWTKVLHTGLLHRSVSAATRPRLELVSRRQAVHPAFLRPVDCST